MKGQLTAVLIILILIGALAGTVYLQRFLMMRAARKIIAQFRKAGATSPETATTLAAMGLGEGHWFRPLRFRDYRPYAARLLGQSGIIRATDEGKVYLSEDDLAESRVRGFGS